MTATGTNKRPQPKLAQQVAAQLEREIIEDGWQVGKLLASEAELTGRFGVSRWVVREALSIAQRDGLVEIRRGRSGGICVAAPALDTVGSSIRSYLGICRITSEDLYEARAALESLAVTMAAERVDDKMIAHLREVAQKAAAATVADSLEQSYVLLRELLLASGNVALLVFSYALAQITADLALRNGLAEASLRRKAITLLELRRRQIEAVVAHDVPTATALVRELIASATAAAFHPGRGKANPDLLSLPRRFVAGGNTSATPVARLAEQVSLRLQADIIGNNWEGGYNLGSEAELLTRFGVSRSVLREAIRPLERLGLVIMRRGRQSGLRVAVPDPASVVRSVDLYLSYAGLDRRAAFATQEALEPIAAARAARLDDESRQALSAELTRIASENADTSLDAIDRRVRQYYLRLARATPTPVVSLFLLILSETMTIELEHRIAKTARVEFAGEVRRCQLALADAIAAGDAALAPRRLLELRRVFFAAGAMPVAFKRPTLLVAPSR